MLAEDTQNKAEALCQVFFLTPPEADLSDILGFRHRQSPEPWVEITTHEVRTAL